MIARLLERERALYSSLEGISSDGVVVIGGYAVSARSVPRYSHDIDLVIDEAALLPIQSFLAGRGFRRTRQRAGIEQNFGGTWERWEGSKGGPTVDLLARSVQDRDFKVPMPFERVARGAEVLPLRGLHASTVALPVASNEVLVALKLQPLRDKDMGDIACLADSGCDAALLAEIVAPIRAARPVLFGGRVERLAVRFGGDHDSAVDFLGPRIPGPRSGRERAVAAAGRLVSALRSA